MEDITTVILLHLPPKSLIRCKCLSKKWNYFISNDSTFHRNYLSKLKSSHIMLGFFSKDYYPYPEDVYPLPEKKQRVKFSPTCNEGRHKHLDQTLEFLGKQYIHIVDSSYGFLLCCLEEISPLNYFICNPITKERIDLPCPSFTVEYVPTGFIFYGSNYPSLTMGKYRVVRALGSLRRAPYTNSLTIQIFSSETKQWNVFDMTCPSSTFSLDCDTFYKSVVVNDKGVVHLLASTAEIALDVIVHSAVLIFDETKPDLELIQVPEEEFLGNNFCFGQSEGNISYLRYNKGSRVIHVWLIKDGQLFLKYKACVVHDFYDIYGFNLLNCLEIYVYIGKNMASYNLETSSMDVIGKLNFNATECRIYPYVWPCWPPLFLDDADAVSKKRVGESFNEYEMATGELRRGRRRLVKKLS